MKKIIFLFILFFIVNSTGYSEEKPDQGDMCKPCSSSKLYLKEFTLNDCINIAVENNQGLKAYHLDILTSLEDIRISGSRLLPAFKVRGHYTLFDRDDIVLTINKNALTTGIPNRTLRLSAENHELYGLSFGIEQTVFAGGRLLNSYTRTKLMSDIARYDFDRQKRLLVADIKQLFYEALKERLYKETAEKLLVAKKERLRMLQELQKEGYANMEELLEMEADLASTETDLYKANNRTVFAMSRLKNRMYYDGDDFVLKGDLQNSFLNVSLQEAQETALLNREDIKILDQKIRISEKDAEIAKSGFLPNATLEGRYTMQKETNITRPEVWALFGQIEWPIFEWGRTRSEVRKAEALNQRRIIEKEELKRTVMLEVEEAWRHVRDMEKEVALGEKKLKAAEFSLKQALEKYHSNILKTADLLETEAKLIKTYNEYLTAINNLNISHARFEAALSVMKEGWISPGDIIKIDIRSHSDEVSRAITLRRENQSYTDNRTQIKEEGHEITENKIQSTESVIKNDGNKSAEIKDQFKARDNIFLSKTSGSKTSWNLFEIQLGTFNTKEAAKKYRESVTKKLKNVDIRIIRQNKLFKVRITGIKSKEDAQNILKEKGIEGLIIRSRHG